MSDETQAEMVAFVRRIAGRDRHDALGMARAGLSDVDEARRLLARHHAELIAESRRVLVDSERLQARRRARLAGAVHREHAAFWQRAFAPRSH